MLSEERALAIVTTTSRSDDNQHDIVESDPIMRDIHALTPPRAARGPRREAWETGSQISSSLSVGSSTTDGGDFTTMSREFSALVLAGTSIERESNSHNNLGRIGEDDHNLLHELENNHQLAIVPDITNPSDGGDRALMVSSSSSSAVINGGDQVSSLQRVKKEEVDSKISAWQNAKVAKVNNRFKREDAVINGWEGEQVQKATSQMKKVERKLEEKRAKALEKMQNDIAKAHRKAEERRASAEAKRGTKVARILEIANLMKVVGRPPVKRSFF